MVNTTLCHIEKDNKYLMLHRIKKQHDLNHDKWIGIGGKFEDKESPEEANFRETLEETGLTLNTAKYCGIVTFVSDKWETEYMHIFHSTDFRGEIKECNEGKLEWVEIQDVYNLPIWEGDKIFLKLIEEKCEFFSLKLEYQGQKLIKAILNGKNLEI